eukprot:1134371-Pelagomonas_calceolata.AAC.5
MSSRKPVPPALGCSLQLMAHARIKAFICGTQPQDAILRNELDVAARLASKPTAACKHAIIATGHAGSCLKPVFTGSRGKGVGG